MAYGEIEWSRDPESQTRDSNTLIEPNIL